MYPAKLSTALEIDFFCFDSNGDGVTGKVDGDWTRRIKKAGGAWGAMTVTIAEGENGWYTLTLSSSHTDTLGVLSISLAASGVKRVNLQFRVHARIPDDLAWPATSGRSLAVSAAGEADAHLTNIAHGGVAATLTLERLIAASTTTNQPAFMLTGNGTAAGLQSRGGLAGDGFLLIGGVTSGAGFRTQGTNGPGGYFLGGGTDSPTGIIALGNDTGSGFLAEGGASGHGAQLRGGITDGTVGLRALTLASNGYGARFIGSGTGVDIDGDLVGAITGNITGNLSGSVGSMGGDVGGKVLGGGAGVIAGTGARVVDGSGNAVATSANQTTLLNRLGAITGTGVNTVLGFFKALLSKVALTPSDIAGTFDPATDSTEAIRDRGDAAWITAVGFSTHTAADVWAVGTRVLTAGTNIQLPSNALANVTAWTVNLTGTLSGTVGGIAGTTTTLDALQSALSSTHGAGSWATAVGFSTLDAAGVRTAVGLGSANLDTQLAAIVGDTNELQTDWTNGGRLDLLVDAVKAKTDSLTFTVASNLDCNVQWVNDVQVIGTGVVGDEWQPSP